MVYHLRFSLLVVMGSAVALGPYLMICKMQSGEHPVLLFSCTIGLLVAALIPYHERRHLAPSFLMLVIGFVLACVFIFLKGFPHGN